MLVHCDNETMVTVLKSDKAKDQYLAAVACNIWSLASF